LPRRNFRKLDSLGTEEELAAAAARFLCA